jgi:hypothetical protein
MGLIGEFCGVEQSCGSDPCAIDLPAVMFDSMHHMKDSMQGD